MKQGLLVTTKNAVRIKNAVNYLHNRPMQEMVGLGLVYGAPGLGKSRVCKQLAIQEGYIYIRLDATTTARSFLQKLYKHILYKENIEKEHVRGSSAAVLEKILDVLRRYPYTIVVDEIDYAFRKKDLLGSIRDIVDHSFSVVLLVGMANAREELLKANAHYFDRCNAFVQLQPLEKSDVASYLAAVSDVKLDSDLIDYIYRKTSGNMRRIVKELRRIEAIAKKHNQQNLTYLFFEKHMREVA